MHAIQPNNNKITILLTTSTAVTATVWYCNPVNLVESFTYLGSIQTSDGYRRPDIMRQIDLASSTMSFFNKIWNTKHLSIQTKVCVYQTVVLSILLWASKTWTMLASDKKATKSFHMKCQERIVGIRWNDFVRNTKVSSCTGLPPVSDWITRVRNAIFRHVVRLPHSTPAHQAAAMPSQAFSQSTSRSNLEASTWSSACQVDWSALPWQQQCSHSDSLEISCWSWSLESRQQRYGPSQLCINDDDDDCNPDLQPVNSTTRVYRYG